LKEKKKHERRLCVHHPQQRRLKLEIEMDAVLTPSIQQIVSPGRLNIVVGEAHHIHTPTTPRKYRLPEETKQKRQKQKWASESSWQPHRTSSSEQRYTDHRFVRKKLQTFERRERERERERERDRDGRITAIQSTQRSM